MEIILIAGKKRSGKNTVAELIRRSLGERHVTNIAFADPLKQMCSDAFGPLIEIINKDLEAYMNIKYAGEKIRPRHPNHTTPSHWWETKNNITRNILQIVGSDIVRKISLNYWVDLTVNNIRELQSKQPHLDFVTISDWRFPNEYKGIAAAFPNTFKVLVTNPSLKDDDKHISENALNDFQFDYVVQNDRDLPGLMLHVGDLVNTLIERGMP